MTRPRTLALILYFGLALTASAECPRCWQPVAGGVGGAGAFVRAMAIFDDGTGEALYVGGVFTDAGGVPVSNLAKWDGSSWSDVGGGVTGTEGGRVDCLFVHDDGSGAALFVGGDFDSAGKTPARNIAKWNGQKWTALGEGVSGTYGWVYAMATYDDGVNGPRLYVGGDFQTAGKLSVTSFAAWDGVNWSKPPGDLLEDSIWDHVFLGDFQPTPDGQDLIVAGYFSSAGGVPARNIARFDGSRWYALRDGLNTTFPGGYFPRISDLAYHHLNETPALTAAGFFFEVAADPRSHLAQWGDDAGWLPVGGGLKPATPPFLGAALAEFDDGAGLKLYVAGKFRYAGSLLATNVASWDGETWNIVGTGVGTNDNTSADRTRALRVFAGDLYAGGGFENSGDLPISRIARYTPLTADLDCDGAVGQSDLGIVLAAYGCDTPPCAGDLDGNGSTGQADLGILLAAYGQRCPN